MLRRNRQVSNGIQWVEPATSACVRLRLTRFRRHEVVCSFLGFEFVEGVADASAAPNSPMVRCPHKVRQAERRLNLARGFRDQTKIRPQSDCI